MFLDELKSFAKLLFGSNRTQAGKSPGGTTSRQRHRVKTPLYTVAQKQPVQAEYTYPKQSCTSHSKLPRVTGNSISRQHFTIRATKKYCFPGGHPACYERGVLYFCINQHQCQPANGTCTECVFNKYLLKGIRIRCRLPDGSTLRVRNTRRGSPLQLVCTPTALVNDIKCISGHHAWR